MGCYRRRSLPRENVLLSLHHRGGGVNKDSLAWLHFLKWNAFESRPRAQSAKALEDTRPDFCLTEEDAEPRRVTCAETHSWLARKRAEPVPVPLRRRAAEREGLSPKSRPSSVLSIPQH